MGNDALKIRLWLVLFLAILLHAGNAALARAEVTQRHREVTQQTFDRLMAVVEQPEGWDVWPPVLKVIDNPQAQALAYPQFTPDGVIPCVEVYTGLIERVADFNPDVLAFVVGHEIGHLVLFHGKEMAEWAQKYGGVRAATAVQAASRDQEFDADLFGMQTALKAGFSHLGIRRALVAMAREQGDDYYCAFEGLRTSHPSWDLRAAYLQEDEQQRLLWRSLTSFRNGVLFLETENYVHAEFCFRKTVEEFPNCYEAWANLGYALLMQYADALDEDDLRNFDVGHLAVGGFYRRPDSLSAQIRSVDEKLWFEAVGAMREALRISERAGAQDDMLMVKANLAVAYLIHPAGKQVGEAERYFNEVFTLLEKPENAEAIPPLVKATIYINAGAGRLLDEQRLEAAIEAIEHVAQQRPEAKQHVVTLTAALDYSNALQLVGSTDRTEQETAFQALERYLTTMSQSSSWWPVAYSQYTDLATRLGQSPKEMKEFRRPSIHDWRPLTSMTLADGTTLGLAQLCEDVLPSLGDADRVVPIIAGTNLKRHYFDDLGISILGSRDILALFVSSDAGPRVSLQRPGVGGETHELHIGMQRREVESLLGDEWDVQFASIDDPETVYQLYRDVGLAVRFKDNQVSELVIVMVPRKQ